MSRRFSANAKISPFFMNTGGVAPYWLLLIKTKSKALQSVSRNKEGNKVNKQNYTYTSSH
jgi:hypothetical protein